MKFDEIREIIGHIQYKPGTTIFCYRHDLNSFHNNIQVNLQIIEIESKETGFIGQSRTFSEEMFSCEKDVLRFVRDLIERAEMHEVDEWFSYKGDRIFNPHAISNP